MKVEELRIGNWYHWYAEGKNYEYQVKGIDLVWNWENFQEIPLTEEWLVKFGFEFTDWLGDWLGSWDLKDGCFGLLKNANGTFIFESKSGTSEIHFVHQLQNLYFALKGEELTVK